MPINVGRFSYDEIMAVLKYLSSGKAARGDEIPPELWKLLAGSEEGVHQLLLLCQACWDQKTVPDKWREVSVALLFVKKKKRKGIATCQKITGRSPY